MRGFTDPLSPASVWQDDKGTIWISMSESDPNSILDVESIDKLVQALLRAREELLVENKCQHTNTEEDVLPVTDGKGVTIDVVRIEVCSDCGRPVPEVL